MKKLLLMLAMTGAALAQSATTTTYTGVLTDLSQQVITSGQVTFTLTPSTDSTLPGTGRFIPSTINCNINVDGTLSGFVAGVVSGPCVVTRNTAITPGGTAYRICIQANFSNPGSCWYDYATTATKDISTPVPTLSTGPVNYGGIPGPPLSFLGVWGSSTVYSMGVAVSYNNAVYVSLTNPNVGNTPSSSTSNWSLVVSPASLTAAPSVTQTVNQPSGTTLQANSFNGVLNATVFSGSDAGAKINAAYAALPARGGMIIYPVASGGESFATPIVFGTANKPVVLSCQGASGSGNDVLMYTGSGTGITFNNGPGSVANGPTGSGIVDCDIQASSTSAILLFLGGANGAEGAMVRSSKFFGGALTVGLGDNTWDVKFDHVKIYGGTQLFVTSGATNAGENIQLDHVVFASSSTFANAVVLGGGASGAGLNLQCNSCSFDNAQLVVSGGEIEINSPHFEDPGGVAWPVSPMIVNGSSVALNTATFFGDHANDPIPPPTISSYISVTAGILITDALDTFGCICTNIYTSSGSGKIIGHTPFTLAGPNGTTVNLIADTSSEPSTVDGGRDYALHAEGPTAIEGYLSFLPTGGIHLRGNTAQSAVGTYLDPATQVNGDIRWTSTPDTVGFYTSKIVSRNCDNLAYNSALDFYTEKKATAGQTDTSTVAATLDCNKVFSVPAVVSTGPIFAVSGCSTTGALGGAAVGQFAAGVTGTCTVVVTMGGNVSAPHGWACGRPNDISNSANSASWSETGFTTNSATLSGTSGVGELIQFSCTGY